MASVSLTCYAALAAIVLVTARAAAGALDLPTIPFGETGIAQSMQHSSLGFYDKSELRLVIAELLLWTIGFAVAFVLLARLRERRTGERITLQPITAAFALILYFAVVRLPPYEAPLASVAAGMAAQLVAGIAVFAVLLRLTGSRAVALLVASWLLLEAGQASDVAYWILAPGIAFVGVRLARAASTRWTGYRLPAPALLCALFLVAFPIGRLNDAVGAYVTRYEPAREKWYRACASGGPCDAGQKPSLRTALRQPAP